MKTPRKLIVLDHLRCGPLKSIGFFKPKYFQDYDTPEGVVRETTTSGKLPKYELITPTSSKFINKVEAITVIFD